MKRSVATLHQSVSTSNNIKNCTNAPIFEILKLLSHDNYDDDKYCSDQQSYAFLY